MVEHFEHQKLNLADRTLAYQQTSQEAGGVGIIFLSGYFSDMTGTKASYLAARCAKEKIPFTRFDYRGHGLSSGTFTDYCISDWVDDALNVLDRLTKGAHILVGSSMGGWIMLRLVQLRPERVAGMVGLAAAPDFTENLVWKKLSSAQKTELQEKGIIYEDSEYGDPLPYTLKLVEDGRNNLVMNKPFVFQGAAPIPVRLLQGMQDKDVPWQTALSISDNMQNEDVRISLIKNSDHRLSEPSDLALLWQQVKEVRNAHRS